MSTKVRFWFRDWSVEFRPGGAVDAVGGDGRSVPLGRVREAGEETLVGVSACGREKRFEGVDRRSACVEWMRMNRVMDGWVRSACV